MSFPLLASALAVALAPAPTYEPSQVEVDASGLQQAGVEQLDSTIEATRTMVDLELRKQLEARGIELVDDGETPATRIEVALFWKDYQTSHFSITIEIVKPDGERVPLPRFDCKHCGNNDLLDRLTAELPAVLSALETPTEPDPAAQKVPAPVVEAPPPADTPARTAEPHPLGSKGKAGIACLAVGGAATVLGGVFVGLGKQPLENTDDPSAGERSSGTDFRPPGIALLSVGGTVMIAGAILLALDRGYARGRTFSMTASQRHVGATFATRF